MLQKSSQMGPNTPVAEFNAYTLPSKLFVPPLSITESLMSNKSKGRKEAGWLIGISSVLGSEVPQFKP